MTGPAMIGMRSALWLPMFNELGPGRHRASPPRRRRPDGTACSCGTTCSGASRSSMWPIRGSHWPQSRVRPSLRIGPMVTPLARRRPAKVAR
jgi:hypothetical protein